MSHAYSDFFNTICQEACISLFDAYDVNLVAQSSDYASSEEVRYCAIIGFTGSHVRGTLLLAMSDPVIEGSKAVAQTNSRDWISELANQLLGNIKNRLIPYGATIYLTTPLVLRGEHLRPVPRHGELEPIKFSVADGKPGNVNIWFESEIVDGFVLNETPENDPDQAKDGDALLFF